MAPQTCDELLGDVWKCDLDDDAAVRAAAEFQDLLEDLVFDVVED